MDKLPKIGVHIEITAERLERAARTGHPKLLCKVLKDNPYPGDPLADVHIGEVTGSVWKGYTWSPETTTT